MKNKMIIIIGLIAATLFGCSTPKMPVKKEEINLAVNISNFLDNKMSKKTVDVFYSYAMDNNNGFVHVLNDSVSFVWSIVNKDISPIINITRVNESGKELKLYINYPHDISWLDSINKMEVIYYTGGSRYELNRNSFEFLSREADIVFTPTLFPYRLPPLNLDTISNEFVRNELQLYRDYVLPLENKEFKIVR